MLLGVSYHTVRRLCDANLLGHYRLPGRKRRRRIPLDALRRYAQQQGIAVKTDSFLTAVPGLEAVLVVGRSVLAERYRGPTREVAQVDGLFLAGMAMARRAFAVVVFDIDELGGAGCSSAVQAIRTLGCTARLVGLSAGYAAEGPYSESEFYKQPG